MDQLVAPAPAEDRLDLLAAMADDARGVGAGVGGQAARQQRPVRARAPRPDRRARTCRRPRARRPAAASCHAASARAAPASTVSVPSGASEPAIQRLRAERPSGAGRNQVQRAPSASARSGCGRCGRARSPWRSRPGGDARRHQLGAHAAGGIAGRRLAAHRLDLRRHRRRPPGCARRPGRAADRRCRARRCRTAGPAGRPATISATRAARRSLSPKRISAVATRVVLVDHRDAAEAEQRVQRRARVQVAAAVLGVVERQQQLRGGQARAPTAPRVQACARRICPTAAAACFSSSRSRVWVSPSAAAGQRDGAGGDHDHLAPRARAARRCRRRRRRARPCAAPPRAGSTTSALPILTTSAAGARRGEGVMRALRVRAASRAAAMASCPAARAAPPARPGR